MYKFVNETGYTKINVWKDEMPISCHGNDTIEILLNGDDIKWYQGTICIEAQLNVWHCSNYAMVCMKYTDTQSYKTEVIIHQGYSILDKTTKLFNNTALLGLNDEFVNAIKEYFVLSPHNKIPCGRIEILGGAYDEVGSSNVSFRNVMNLLTYVFCNEMRLENNGFGEELFRVIHDYWALLRSDYQ